ncbi:MAG: tRNA (adenosine(37)-N6)-threonylcarbamoyltransferase complex transferase subunit TsaD, partial [Apilactobacillus sp.]|nr:tRNA (adenosine(37)-N6)-threonylcarbamoyltransferase complex transferase subunit TsaD [Apilactobacillus sp.]
MKRGFFVQPHIIMSFESSCDETSVAIIEDGEKILSNVVATQINSHKRFGGVVPEV